MRTNKIAKDIIHILKSKAENFARTKFHTKVNKSDTRILNKRLNKIFNKPAYL